jgi:hypothetical protein
VRIANVAGRATLVGADGAGLDVELGSGGRFPSNPQTLFDEWDAFLDWGAAQEHLSGAVVDPGRLAAPTPAPRQVFALALNYAASTCSLRNSFVADAGYPRPPAGEGAGR